MSENGLDSTNLVLFMGGLLLLLVIAHIGRVRPAAGDPKDDDRRECGDADPPDGKEPK